MMDWPDQKNDPPDYSISGESPLDHHKRPTPYRSKRDSLEMRTRPRDTAWAMSILSKGSRSGPGSAPARAASSTVMGNSSKPWPAMAPGMPRAIDAASSSLPRSCFVAISQAEAALTNTAFASSSMARRARPAESQS